MPYRQPTSPVQELIAEINALDAAVGAWSVSVAAGTRAPPHVVTMMERKESLMHYLRTLAGRPPTST